MKIEDAVKGLGSHLVSRMAILVAMSLPAALLFAQVEDAPGIGVQILEDASVVLPDPAPETNASRSISTIQEAIDNADPGDVILIDPGTYIGSIRFNGKDVAVRSTEGPEVTTIVGDGGAAVVIGPGGELSGFTITGGSASFGAGMEARGSGSVVKGNIFEGNSQGGGGFGAGIGGNSASPLIEGNVFRNNSCDSQFLSGVVSLVNSSSPQVVNNLFVDNPCRAVNFTLPVGNAPKVVNNTMVGNRVGVRVDRRISTVAQVYSNNVIVGNEIGLEIDFGSEANNPTWRHNLVFDNDVDYETITDQTGINGNISMDPMFVATALGDFRLLATSPAIDAGDNAAPALPTTDFEGDPRLLDGDGDGGTTVDIGFSTFLRMPMAMACSTRTTTAPSPRTRTSSMRTSTRSVMPATTARRSPTRIKRTPTRTASATRVTETRTATDSRTNPTTVPWSSTRASPMETLTVSAMPVTTA
jgi:hypothetical protein